jgi:regulatory protein
MALRFGFCWSILTAMACLGSSMAVFFKKMDHRITALKVQKKNPNRVSVYLDGEFAFGVSRIVAAWLQVGQDLSDEKIVELQQQETQEASLQKAMLLLSYRPRSEAEIRQRLREDGFEPEVIAITVDRLRLNGLLQDENFAQTWIENRGAFRPRSQKMLAFELRRKGIAEETIQQALAESSSDNDLAYQAAARYARKLAGTEWEEFHRRLLAFLGRRGFSYGTSAPVVRQVWDELQSGDRDVRYSDNEDKKNG